MIITFFLKYLKIEVIEVITLVVDNFFGLVIIFHRFLIQSISCICYWNYQKDKLEYVANLIRTSNPKL